MTAQAARAADTYESAKSGTIYWTLSLYIEADRAAAALGLKPGARIGPETFRRMQRSHRPSLALANAIDALMNDIADRETQGEVQEFLLAVTDEDVSDMDEAAAAARRYDDLVFKMPKSISWTTEGVRFEASPPGLDREREVQLRRFWLSHNNGALSYHLSFSHFYGAFEDEARGACSGYAPSTYYFLSLLQKLAAPKEYGLDADILEDINRKADPYIDVFDPDPLGIDPLDNIEVRYRPPGGKGRQCKVERFWPFVRTMFEADAEVLFDRLVRTDRLLPKDETDRFTLKIKKGGYTDALVELVPFIEVPGLKVPKSRFMFMLHDERFFERLMPLDADRKESVSRKAMVRQDCYEPYETRISALMDEASRRRSRSVRLDEDYWTWVCTRPEYDAALDEGAFARAVPDVPTHYLRSEQDPHWSPIRRLEEGDETDNRPARDPLDELVTAMRAGECFQRYAFDDRAPSRPLAERALPAPVKHHIPAFEAHRADCLDYLFLAGFNQNIIDFMNQDTSEILDSIDPIYPDSSDQSSDRFFVRYANHRAMITYVPKSRSLETGNDYIGACPYAFLIHVLALHNEFLARSHEQKTMTRIERIEALIYGRTPPATRAMALLEQQEALDEDDDLSRAEMAINQARRVQPVRAVSLRQSVPLRDRARRVQDAGGASRHQPQEGSPRPGHQEPGRPRQRPFTAPAGQAGRTAQDRRAGQERSRGRSGPTPEGRRRGRRPTRIMAEHPPRHDRLLRRRSDVLLDRRKGGGAGRGRAAASHGGRHAVRTPDAVGRRRKRHPGGNRNRHDPGPAAVPGDARIHPVGRARADRRAVRRPVAQASRGADRSGSADDQARFDACRNRA
ncbi:hypothetical protein [Brevundimonas sp. Marseille-Q4549]